MEKALTVDGIDLYKINLVENYLISKNGDVYSINSKKFLKELTTGRGYKHYILRYNKNKTFYSQHVLLCLAFKYYKGCEKLTVDHIDGNPSNNNIDNLEWVTIKENIRRYHKGPKKKRISEAIIVKDYKNNKVFEYKDYKEAAKGMGLHRYEILRRLNNYFGFMFSDYTMIKLKDNKQQFPIVPNIIEYRINCQNIKHIKAYNHFTKENRKFKTMTEAANFINFSIGRFSTLLNQNKAIFNNGWEFVTLLQNIIPKTKDEVEKLTRPKDKRRVLVIENNKETIFESAVKVCEKYGFKKTTFNKYINRAPSFTLNNVTYSYID